MEPSQSKVIRIPTGYTQSQRENIGNDIINRIKRRTREGLDINGNFFAPYSDSYEKQGTVNLRVSGDMLEDLIVLGTGSGFVRIGFQSQRSNDKAGFIQVPKGQKRDSPRRSFVGISQQDLSIILERYPQN